MTDSVADILDKAADLIAAPGAWTQFTFANNGSARDEEGQAIWAPSPNAKSWCVYGAVSQICVGDFDRSYEACRTLEKAHDESSLTNWNDAPERTQDEVVAKLREAAAKARGLSS